jgi:hypothetical protein
VETTVRSTGQEISRLLWNLKDVLTSSVTDDLKKGPYHGVG